MVTVSLLSSSQVVLEGAASSRIRFEDGSESAGLSSFILTGGSTEKRYLVEGLSGGVCLLDYDNDGFLDIYFVNGGTVESFRSGAPSGLSNALFRNRGDRTFQDVTAQAGVEGNGAWGFGCSVADYDNDGWSDLYVTTYGSNILYRNLGDGRFEDVTGTAGVNDPRWSAGSAWADYNGDGWPDLFVANYLVLDRDNLPEPGSKFFGSMASGSGCRYAGLPVMCGPRRLPGAGDTLYRNNGDGTFSDVSREAGVDDPKEYYGLGAIWCDFDNDVHPDLYVANDSKPNYLYHNRGDGTFEEIGYLSGAAVNEQGDDQGGMGVACGDYENSGALAVFVTNFSDETNVLYRNEGQLTFFDATLQAGLGPVSLPYVGWGTFFFDVDNDGWLDLFFANGHIYPQIDQAPGLLVYRQRNLLFRNLGNGRFEEVPDQALGVPSAVSRGAVRGDLDNDGDLDIVIANLDDSPTLLWNQTEPRQNFLILKLVGTQSTRDALGARVRIRIRSQWQVREVRAGGSYLGNHDPRLHFGLGSTERVEEIQVRWPNGFTSVLRDVPANQFLILRELPSEFTASPSPHTEKQE